MVRFGQFGEIGGLKTIFFFLFFFKQFVEIVTFKKNKKINVIQNMMILLQVAFWLFCGSLYITC